MSLPQYADSILAFIAAIAPAYIAFLNIINNYNKLVDECVTLRDIIAEQLTKISCRDKNRILEAMRSAQCELIMEEGGRVKRAIIASIILSIYLVAASLDINNLWLFLLAVFTPYVVLWGFVSSPSAGILASARALASQGVCPDPGR